MAEEEDPYAVSSDSDDEDVRKPPPKIQIEGRENADLNKLKSALLNDSKEVVLDEERKNELEQLKQARDTKKMKEDFESGAVTNKDDEGIDASKAALEEERQKLTEIGKEKYSKFKDKFENIDSTLGDNLEEKLKKMERDISGLGKDTLASAKEKFEKGEGDITVEKTQVDIERSTDLQKMKAAFTKDMTADEAPKECAICGKIVYPVERVFINKQLYHVNCFRCNKCSKKLTPTNYNMHKGILLCKVHMIEVEHPEMAKTMDPANTEEDEHGGDQDDDEEFAVSSKPKQLSGVVKSGASAVHDELAQLKSLKEKRGDFESSVKEAANIEKKTKVEDEVLQTGRVQSNKEKFASGAALEHEDEDEISGERDPNIIREEKKKRREELHFDQVGDIKNKWKTGAVETAGDRVDKTELEELKASLPSVKERFQEKKEAESSVIERQWDRSELDTGAAAEARKSFMEGVAYQSGTVEKTVTDLDELKFTQLKGFKEKFEKGEGEVEVQKTAVEVADVQLGNIKAAFEKSEEEMTPEERAAQKKKEIEAEFLRYKLARRAAAERVKQQEEDGTVPVVEPGEGGADVGSIKDRFDHGEAFKAQDQADKQLDVEFKMAGKAREKFKQIDASGATPVMPGQNKKAEPSKWDKKDDKPVAEVINRRDQANDEPSDEDEDAFDVKNLMNKFKNIGENSASSQANSEQRAELSALRTEARNFKQRFEQRNEEDADVIEEKKKQMQEEFELLKREREEAQKRLEEERAQEEAASVDKEEINIKADHASKMAAKWEKIQAKEAKKAEKGKMPEKKSTTKFVMRSQPKCEICTTTVYMAEQFQCFGILYHVKCFRCSVCRQALRVEKVHRNSEGQLYCPVHFKLANSATAEADIMKVEENNNNIKLESL
ncbi:unnamed protein product [Auanema sp. JU1783]|nr:unnamed protein product [Auanema sp. JU1783]